MTSYLEMGIIFLAQGEAKCPALGLRRELHRVFQRMHAI